MPQLINWELAANPINWIIVGLMLAIATFGLSVVLNPGSGLVASSGSAGQ
jgi:hypothetical protein